jgi:hypothetical protein
MLKLASLRIADDLIASECSCKASCKNGPTVDTLGEERILCTHGLMLPTQFVLFLYQGLREHLLVELRNRLMVNGNLSFPGFDEQVAFRLPGIEANYCRHGLCHC